MSGEVRVAGASNWRAAAESTGDAEPMRLAAEGDEVRIVRVCPMPLTKLEAGQSYSFDAVVDYTLVSRSSATLEFAVYQFGKAAGTTGRIAAASTVVSAGSGKEHLAVDIVAPNNAEAIRVVANLRVDALTLVRGGLFSDPYPLVEGTPLYFGNCLRRIPPNHLAVGEELTPVARMSAISPAGGRAPVAPQAVVITTAGILKAIHLGLIALHILLEPELVGDPNPGLIIAPNVLESVSGSIGPNQRRSIGVVEVGARSREHLVSIDIHADLPEGAQVILYDPE
jgi:hypothetical protein